jgi:hypothetical protein
VVEPYCRGVQSQEGLHREAVLRWALVLPSDKTRLVDACHSGYTVDDGHGGKFHVDVRFILPTVMRLCYLRFIREMRTLKCCRDSKCSADGLCTISTSYENIGDSGLIQSYRAWKAQFSDSLKSGNEYILPGLNYTRSVPCTLHLFILTGSTYRDQLFFISFAQIWADKIRPSAAVRFYGPSPLRPPDSDPWKYCRSALFKPTLMHLADSAWMVQCTIFPSLGRRLDVPKTQG